MTTDHVARYAGVALLDRAELAAQVRALSMAAQQVTDSRALEPLVDIAQLAIGQLPAIAQILQDAVADERRPAFQRIGALAGLVYSSAPLDAVADHLPGGYGLLDDWLVMNATRWTYVSAPDEKDVPRLTEHAQFVWLCLPPAVVPALHQFIARIGQECVAMAQVPEAQARQLLAQLMVAETPIVLPIASPASVGPRGGWSTHAAGAIWGSGDGRATYMRFEGGGSVGMVNGKIVGGP